LFIPLLNILTVSGLSSVRNITPIKLRLNKAFRNLQDYLGKTYFYGAIPRSDQRYILIWEDYIQARSDLLEMDKNFFNSIDNIQLPPTKLVQPKSSLFDGESYVGFPDGSRNTIKAAIENAQYYIKEYENLYPPNSNNLKEEAESKALVIQIIRNWANMISSFKQRRSDIKPIVVTNEYELQYLLEGILRLLFEDVRPEPHTLNYGNKSNRVDFILPKQKILIETKMTRQGLDGKKLHEELIIDKEHYRRYPGIENILCFVYDPERKIKNPEGIKDIEELINPPYFTIHFAH